MLGRIALTGTVYKKIFALSLETIGETTIGRIINLAANDVQRVEVVRMGALIWLTSSGPLFFVCARSYFSHLSDNNTLSYVPHISILHSFNICKIYHFQICIVCVGILPIPIHFHCSIPHYCCDRNTLGLSWAGTQCTGWSGTNNAADPHAISLGNTLCQIKVG